MLDADTPATRLDLVNRFLGWGSPHRAIWFVGLEEGGEFKDDYFATLRERSRDPVNHALPGTPCYIQSHACMAFDSQTPNGPLQSAEEWLVRQLISDPPADEGINAAFRARLWQHMFHCNLYPLGYQRSGAGFPTAYLERFGLSGTNDPVFVAATKQRLQWLQELKSRCRPSAIICFGLGEQHTFAQALNLTPAGDRRLGSRGNRCVLFRDPAAIVPHASGRFSRHRWQDMRHDLATLLRDEWEIQLDLPT